MNKIVFNPNYFSTKDIKAILQYEEKVELHDPKELTIYSSVLSAADEYSFLLKLISSSKNLKHIIIKEPIK